MYYKRISDLHPLGKPNNNDWGDIIPLPIPNIGMFYEHRITNKTQDYSTISSKFSVASQIDILTAAFNGDPGKKWWSTQSSNVQYTHVDSIPKTDDGTVPGMSSEYYAKSLWFEVAISKTLYGQPTSTPSAINHYQSKRVNAYQLLTNIDEISAREISANVLSANHLHCSDLTSKIINSTAVCATSITANYADISSLKANSITADAISSYLGWINDISGDNLYYRNAKFTNITVTGVADLTAEAAYWADVAEIYEADNEYLYGTLVKFGGEKEITIADKKANAVISEKPAILLNSGGGEKIGLPIVLAGRSNVRVIHPINKFDKIYLSEKPGIGCAESYKISSCTEPMGIALESKPSDEEGLVECVLQMNFS